MLGPFPALVTVPEGPAQPPQLPPAPAGGAPLGLASDALQPGTEQAGTVLALLGHAASTAMLRGDSLEMARAEQLTRGGSASAWLAGVVQLTHGGSAWP